MSFRIASPYVGIVLFSLLVPVACGDDSDDDGGGGAKGGEAGEAGDGGTNQGGSSARGGSAGSGAQGGSSGRGGSSGSGTGGSAGASGAGGDGGVGASGGAGGSEGGEGGAGGEPGCTILNDATITGMLKITTDDNYRLYVNGALIDETPRLWSSPQMYTVTLYRNPSRKNVLAIEGINAAEIDGLDRGIIADLSFDAGGGAQSVLTDTSWKLSTTLVTDWFSIAFNDTSWVAATDEGAHGITPYNMVLGTSSARWIWAYDANVAASAKMDPPESVFVRKSFYVNVAGTVTSTPTPCP